MCHFANYDCSKLLVYRSQIFFLDHVPFCPTCNFLSLCNSDTYNKLNLGHFETPLIPFFIKYPIDPCIFYSKMFVYW